jgi:hypothetical protein
MVNFIICEIVKWVTFGLFRQARYHRKYRPNCPGGQYIFTMGQYQEGYHG